MKILLPISLDRWRNPISTLLRACVQYNPDLEFHSFSNPETEEDRELGEAFWKLPNLHRREPSALWTDRFDIVHTASYSHGNYVAAVLAKLRGWGHTRFLNTMNLEQHPSHPVCWARYRRVRRWADGFVAVSEAVAKDLRERMPDRFKGVIPNGFDDVFFDPSIEVQEHLPAELASHEKHSFVLTISALEQRKRPDHFIALAQKMPHVRFVWAGVLLQGAEHYAEKLESLPNVTWLKGVNKQGVRALLHHAAVFLFPSDREGLPLALIEALGMGLPAIAQPKSSMPELIRHGQNGQLLDLEQIELWIKAIEGYLALPNEERTVLGLSIRQQVTERFVWPVIGASYGPVYQSLARADKE